MGLERLDQVLGGLQQVHESSLKGFWDLRKGPQAESSPPEENTAMTLKVKEDINFMYYFLKSI